MKREIYQKLVEWKLSKRRKPLLLKGARQTGKTYILKEFGKSEYENVFYFNFEENPALEDFFIKNLNPKKIIDYLSAYQKQEIKPGSDLIIFDEVQASNNALNSLKYFQEEANEFHIAAAGSLIGVKLSIPKSFPVGKVNFLELYPLTFFEFLDAVGSSKYRELLEDLGEISPLPEIIHEELIDILRQYYFIGGMPEAVKYYIETKDLFEVRNIHKEIINSYMLDFAKHALTTDIPKLSFIWNSIPYQLAKENKKFIFSAVQKGARAREYQNALIWLEDAGLIYRSFSVSVSKHPIKAYADPNCYKVFSLDVGLLGAMANIQIDVLTQGDRLLKEYKGAFVENYVAQQLLSSLKADLLYWRSTGKMAEVDFLCEIDNRIYPLEVKAGINPKSKSLRSYDNQFHPKVLVRTTLLNLKLDGKICNIPLYAAQCLKNIIRIAVNK